MNLVLHIFRKDTRHLYPEILLTLALTTAFASTAPAQWKAGIFYMNAGGIVSSLAPPLLRILLPIAWLVLIARLIHDESLVGDRQFWITRPYTWPVLLASKLLFLLVFLYLPFLLMQLFLLHHAGLDIPAALPDLVRYDLRLTAIFFIPFLVIAAVTSTFARVALSALAALLYLAAVAVFGAHLLDKRMLAPGIETLCAILFCAALAAILLLQYATRRTRISRALLLGLPILLLLIVLLAPAKPLIEHTYTALSGSFTPTLALDRDPLREEPGSGPPLLFESYRLLSLPLQQAGIFPGLRFKTQGIAVTIYAPDGFHWSSPFFKNSGTDLSAETGNPAINLLIPAPVFDRIRDLPVDLHLQIAVLVYATDPPVTASASSPSFAAPGGGLCALLPGGIVPNCRYALRLPTPIDLSAEVSDHFCDLDGTRGPSGNGPVRAPPNPQHQIARTFIGSDDTPLAFDFDPVATTPINLVLPSSTPDHFLPAFLCPSSPVTFTPHRLLSHSQIVFDVRHLVLAPFAKRQRSSALQYNRP